MTKREDNLRSEEVVEILSKTPIWMIRWGNVLFLSIFILLLIISWFVKYPDIIESKVIVTTIVPPHEVYARKTGKLDSIYINDSEVINRNTILSVIENTANTDDVYYLKSILDTLTINKRIIDFPINEIPILLLGEIEKDYAIFENNYVNYRLNKALKPFKNEKLVNKISLNELKIRLQNMLSQYALNKTGLKLKRNNLKRNKSLLDKGVISQLDYENKQLDLLIVQKELKSLSASISQIRESLANANKDLKGTEIIRITEEAKLLRDALQSYNQLKKSITDWENNYVLKSKINGKVSFLNFWNANQTVNEGEIIFTIIPNHNNRYIAKVRAAPKNSGKIKINQRVNIKLQNYPETEFGMLTGYISKIYNTPDSEGFYHINVKLPKKLITSYNKEIRFQQQMTGTSEIITEDLRLIERILYNFKKIITE